MGIELRYVDRTGQQWPLPDAMGVVLSPVLGDEGAIEFSYPLEGKNFDKIKPLDEFDVAVIVNGVRQASLDAHIVEIDGDEAKDATPWKFTGYTNNGRLNDAQTKPNGWPNSVDPKDPVMRFSAVTSGTLVGTLMQQAQARGTLTDFTYGSFTTTRDSNGVLWNKSLSIEYKAGVSYLEVLRNLYAQGMLEFQVVGKDLRLYVPNSMMVDRTLQTPPLTFRRGQLLDSPRKRSARDRANAYLVVGDEGLLVERVDQVSVDGLRRIEGSTSQGGINDMGTLTALAELGVARSSGARMEKTHGLTLETGSPLPIIDFQVGDWAYSDTTGVLERLRIKQWTMSQNDDGTLTGSVVLNDLFAEQTALLARRVDGIIGGSTLTGGSKATDEVPSDLVDGKPPAIPTSLGLASEAYTDSIGQTMAQVTAGWAQVTTNADGTIISDLRGYQVRWSPNSSELPDPVIDGTVPEDQWQRLIANGWQHRGNIGSTPLKTQAAQELADRLASGQDVYEDLSFRGMSANLVTYLDEIADAVYAANPGMDWPKPGVERTKQWLSDYIRANGPRPTKLFHPLYQSDTWRYVGETETTRLSWSPMQPGIPIYVQVRSIDKAGNYSPWTVSVGILTAVDTTPPPKPSKPTMENYMGLLRIYWDGGFAADNEGTTGRPRDFRSVDLHLSETENFVPDETTRIGSMRNAGVQFYDPAVYGQLYYVKLIAYDNVDNASVPSDQVSAAAVPVVSVDVNGNVTDTSFIQYRDEGNLIEDGGFAIDWMLASRLKGTAWVETPGEGVNASAVRKASSATAGTPVITLLSNSPVTPSTTLFARLKYRSVGANGLTQLRFTWTKRDGTTTSEVGTAATLTTQTAWGPTLGRYVTVPADAVTLTVTLETASHTAGAWEVDDVEVRKVMGTSLIEDAAISRAKIGLLAVGSAQIEELNVGKLTSGVGQFELVLAGRITTALTGQRMEMNGLGLYGYTASEALSIRLDGVSNLLAGTFMTALTGRRIQMTAGGTSGQALFFAPDGRVGRIISFTEGTGLEAMRFEAPRPSGEIAKSYINLNSDNYTQQQARIHEFVTTPGSGPEQRFVYFINDGTAARTRFLVTPEVLVQYGSNNTERIRSGDTFKWTHPVGSGAFGFEMDSTAWFHINRGNSNGRFEFRTNNQGSAIGGTFCLFAPNGYGVGIRVAADASAQQIDVVNPDSNVWYSIRASQFLAQSDEASKTDIHPVATSDMLVDVLNMPVKRYHRMNSIDEDGNPCRNMREEIGFIAQNTPSRVSYVSSGTQFVDQYQTLALAVGAIQELKKLNDVQQKELDAMKGKFLTLGIKL